MRSRVEAETAAEEVRAAGRPWQHPAGWEWLREGRAPWVPYLPALAAEELPRVLDDLLVREEAVGLLLAQHKHLPQGHPKRPHVAGCGELALWTERICSAQVPVQQSPFSPHPLQLNTRMHLGKCSKKSQPSHTHRDDRAVCGAGVARGVPQALRRCSFHRGKAGLRGKLF